MKPQKIRHVYPKHVPKSESDLKRYALAKKTWESQKWEDMPVDQNDLSRAYLETDTKIPLPYVRDIIDFGTKDMLYQDIVVFTNTDICVVPEFVKIVKEKMKKVDSAYSHRVDYKEPFNEPKTLEELKSRDDFYGVDTFIFNVSWWKENRKKFPSMLIAREAWDAAMLTLVQEGGQWPSNKIEKVTYHQKHESFWEQPDIKYRLSGNRYNIERIIPFFKERKIVPERHGIIPRHYGIK
jgi:hypothetical protein